MEVEKDKSLKYRSEFVVRKANIHKVRTFAEKIFTLFEVKVDIGKISPKAYREHEPQQWITVQGRSEENCSAAKDYILGLTAPEVNSSVSVAPGKANLSKEDQMVIERQSHAVLYWDSKQSVWKISGAELAVVVAQSLIDAQLSIAGKPQESNKENDDDYIIIDDEEDEEWINIEKNSAIHDESQSQNHEASRYVPPLVFHTSPPQQQTQSFSASDHIEHIPVFPPSIPPFTSSEPMATSLYIPQGSNIGTSIPFTAPGPVFRPYPVENLVHNSTQRPYFGGTQPLMMSPAPEFSRFGAPQPAQSVLPCAKVPDDSPGVCNPSKSVNHNRELNVESDQAKAQKDYLYSVGCSYNHSKEDIALALDQYDMEDIIKPTQFLKTLAEIKSAGLGAGTAQVSSTLTPISKVCENTDRQKVVTESGACRAEYVISDDESETYDLDPDTNQAEVSEFSVLKNIAPGTGARPKERARPEAGTGKLFPRQTLDDGTRLCGVGGSSCETKDNESNLRFIVIDGSNVAMCHGDNKVFSTRGLEICINYFRQRGHNKVIAFVSESYRYSQNPIHLKNRQTLEQLHKDGWVKFTPARRINGKCITSYEDRFILNLAMKEDAVIVSNDQFRDLCEENPKYLHLVENRLLQYVFAGDHFMPPDDPLGRMGPSLDQFLRKDTRPRSEPTVRPPDPQSKTSPVRNGKTWIRPTDVLRNDGLRKGPKQSIQSSRNEMLTAQLYAQLSQIFPEPWQQNQLRSVLENHRDETDINTLTNFCLSALTL